MAEVVGSRCPLERISLIYVHYIRFALPPLRWTIEIGTIFADNIVTVNGGRGSHIAFIQTEKWPQGKLQNVPKIH